MIAIGIDNGCCNIYSSCCDFGVILFIAFIRFLYSLAVVIAIIAVIVFIIIIFITVTINRNRDIYSSE